jgi:tetratricopeptide (TPR) repeat protein
MGEKVYHRNFSSSAKCSFWRTRLLMAISVFDSTRIDGFARSIAAGLVRFARSRVANCMLGWILKSHKGKAPESSTPGLPDSRGSGVEDPVVAVPQKLDVALQRHRAGRLSEAEAAYGEVLAVNPENIDALHFLGVIAYQRGEHGRAEELISRALSRNTSNAPAYNNLGNALGAQGKLDAAVVCYERALALQPGYADALVNLGAAFRAKGEPDKAVQCYQHALLLAPDLPMAHFNLGNALAQQGKLDDAAACLRKALALKPDFAEALCSLGNVLRNQGRLDEATDCLHKALALKPDFPEAYDHLSSTLIGLGRPDEAEESYRRALALRPDSAELKLGYSLVKLLLGDYESGFLLYESRLDKDALPQATYSALQERIAQLGDAPRWQGESGEGKTLLVWTDQGLGDTLMMMRYLPMLKERGFEKVVVSCEQTLVRVVQEIPGVDEVVPRSPSAPVGGFDCHCPLTSLPFMFKTRVESIPSEIPYLHVPDQLRRKWAGKLAGLATPRVGLAWAGRKDHPQDALRSIRLERLSPLFGVAGVNFVNLQKGPEARQIGETGLRILDRMDECGDLLETAALMGQLDLVISVDTAVMHLTGALGKPVWHLNRFETEWLWMLKREDSPWYPSMRIFRQQRPGSWDEVIARVASALAMHFNLRR